MSFDIETKARMFSRCARVCCLCFKQCGTNIEAAHIMAESDGGSNDEDNGIPLCFDCHQEIGAYNDKHPKGNKFTPIELKARRDRLYSLIEKGFSPTRQVPIPDEIFMNISVNNKSIETPVMADFEFPEERMLSYRVTKDVKQLQIDPQMGYLSKLGDGGPVSGFKNMLSPFRWYFPKLDIKILNDSTKAIFLAHAIFKIQKSVLDPSPVLLIRESPSKFTHFELFNEGWGGVSNCSIKFNIVTTENKPLFGGQYSYEERIGDFFETYDINLSNALRDQGVDVDSIDGIIPWVTYIEGLPTVAIWNEKEKFKTISTSALGPFKNGEALVFGEITYSGRKLDGKLSKNVLKFSTYLSLFRPPGAPLPPTYEYRVMFDIGKNNYQVKEPISQCLESGKPDRFDIVIGAPKSSLHVFRLELKCIDGKCLMSQPIILKIFLPRSQIGQIGKVVSSKNS